LPPREAFVGTATSSPAEGYYSTLCHELTHFTSVEHRCNRQLGKRFGDQAYAMEELVAELGAAFLCADLGISDAPRADHAQYLTTWLSVLKADKKAIFTAASKASEAATFLASARLSLFEHLARVLAGLVVNGGVCQRAIERDPQGIAQDRAAVGVSALPCFEHGARVRRRPAELFCDRRNDAGGERSHVVKLGRKGLRPRRAQDLELLRSLNPPALHFGFLA
jgi:hypothetical protein